MQPAKREDVALGAESRHQSHGEVGEQRFLPPALAREQVREMNFDERDPHGEQRIPDREAGVGVRPAIQDQSLGAAGKLLDGVDERALVIGLGEGNPDFEARRFFPNHPFDVSQRPVSVDRRFSLAQKIEVRTVENGDPKGQRLSPLSHSLN